MNFGQAIDGIHSLHPSLILIKVLDKRQVKTHAEHRRAVIEGFGPKRKRQVSLQLKFELLEAGTHGDGGLEECACFVGFGGACLCDITEMVHEIDARRERSVDPRAADADAGLQEKLPVEVLIVFRNASIARTEAAKHFQTGKFAQAGIIACRSLAVEVPEGNVAGIAAIASQNRKCIASRGYRPMVIGTISQLRTIAVAPDIHPNLQLVTLAHQGHIRPIWDIEILAGAKQYQGNGSKQQTMQFHVSKVRGMQRDWQVGWPQLRKAARRWSNVGCE